MEVEGVDEVDDSFEVSIEEDETFSVSQELMAMFTEHTNHLRERREKRKRELTLKPLVSTAPVASTAQAASTSLAVAPDADGEGEQSGQEANVVGADGEVDLAASVSMRPGDQFEGDLVLRRLNLLLERIDKRGFQRSRQQVSFHDAFVRATSRVMFKADWQSSRPEIMRKYQWDKAPSEILVSTPRRFGKTFS
jgi:hypothetical protein